MGSAVLAAPVAPQRTPSQLQRMAVLHMDATITKLNALDAEAARAALMRCCGSTRWADSMLKAMPFSDAGHLFDAADLAWWALGGDDWKEAFSHHPKIGSNMEALRAKFPATSDWSAGEQAGVAGASEATLQALAKGNRDYDERFGHVFLICATGKRCGTSRCL
jgi:2-oxo-4-hydroxy-4-carboxy-5-ureidoimidazoline decarboxylase